MNANAREAPGRPVGDPMPSGAQVVVIGGGPAGASAATILAQAGLKTVLLERERFPRFHVGESLMTETYWTFQRIGMLDRLKASDFPRKYSVQFFSASGKPSRPFYFQEHNPHESAVTWQVERSEFDRMLVENAAERGAAVRTGARVDRVIFDGIEKRSSGGSPAPGSRSAPGKVRGVRGQLDDGRDFEIACDVVVDASGLGSVIARQLGIVRKDPCLDKAAIYAHYEGAHRDSGIDEGATVIVNTREYRGWFWTIPLSRNRVSIGVVGSRSDLLKDRGSPATVLDEEIADCPTIRDRLAGARRISDVRVTSDYTWRASRCAGDGWVLAGDAFGFIDPIYSSGVLLALKSGELAADCVAEAFDAGDLSGERLGAFGPVINEGMQAMRKLVYAYYTPGFSFANFVNQHPEHRSKLIQLLIGDVFREPIRDIFEDLGSMCNLPESMPLERA